MAVFLSRRWTIAPRTPVSVNGNHALSPGLVFASYVVSGAFYDAVSRQSAMHPSTLRPTYSKDGNATLAMSAVGAAATGGQFPQRTGLDAISGALSLFVQGSLEVNATTQAMVASYETANGDGFTLKLDDFSFVTNSFIAFANNAALNAPSTMDGLGVNSEQFTHRVMYTLDGTNVRHYSKNALDKTAASAVLPNANANRRTMMCGRDSNTQQSGSVALALAWNRALSLPEYQALYENPWQVFQPIEQRIYVNAAAGGTFKPFWAVQNNSVVGVGVH